jgi:hypothetical protein
LKEVFIYFVIYLKEIQTHGEQRLVHVGHVRAAAATTRLPVPLALPF